jgi:hypothetical protein
VRREQDKIIPLVNNFFKMDEIWVDESVLMGYNVSIVHKQKAVKGRVDAKSPFREPRLVEWGTGRGVRTWSRSCAGDR